MSLHRAAVVSLSVGRQRRVRDVTRAKTRERPPVILIKRTVATGRHRWALACNFRRGVPGTKLLAFAITGLLSGSLGAAIVFETHAQARIRQSIARVRVYPVNETKPMDPTSLVTFDANCRPGDLPLAYTFATANLDLSLASPQLRGATPNPTNGFTVLLFNSADQTHPPQPVTVTTLCWTRR